MSCCGGCKDWGNGMGNYGLYGWRSPGDQSCGRNGLGSLGDADPYVQSGSVVTWRGSIQKTPNGGWIDSIDATDVYVQPRLEDALVRAGFPGVIIEERGFFDHDNSITVVTSVDYGALNHVAQVIEGAIYSLGYYPVRKRYELITTPSSSPRVIQPGQQAGGADVITRAEQERRNRAAAAAAAGGFNFCETFPLLCPDPNEESFLDKLARMLGVTSEAAIIGAGVAIVGIIALKRLL